MQRQRYSKILQSDYFGTPDRAPGMPILQSHGNLVSRGDLITQDNMSASEFFTITINKDTFSQLCIANNPGQLVDYSFYMREGQIRMNSNGIYAECGITSAFIWHGPIFYTILPQAVGTSDKYWHIVYKYFIDNSNQAYYINIITRIGFSLSFEAYDGDTSGTGVGRQVILYNSSTSKNYYYYPYSGTVITPITISDTFKVYHYPDNTMKIYVNGSTLFSGQDPIQLNKGNNIITSQIARSWQDPLPLHYISEITVSTDPTYDPQP